MKCACCGRKKKLFESFENLGKDMDVCEDCSDIMYRIQDAYKESNKAEFDVQVKKVREFSVNKKSSQNFKKWFEEEFLKRFEFKNKPTE